MTIENQAKIPAAIENILAAPLKWGDPSQVFAMKRFEEWCRINDLLKELDSLPVWGYNDKCPLCNDGE